MIQAGHDSRQRGSGVAQPCASPRWISTCSAVIFCVVLGWMICKWRPATPVEPVGNRLKRPVRSELDLLLLRIMKEGELSGLDVDNSEVVVYSDEISTLVAEGLQNVPDMVRLMKRDDLTFDAFTRCYSMCNQILRNQNSALRVYWTGGAQTKRLPGQRTYVESNWATDQQKFRRKVVADIEAKYLRVLQKSAGQ